MNETLHRRTASEHRRPAADDAVRDVPRDQTVLASPVGLASAVGDDADRLSENGHTAVNEPDDGADGTPTPRDAAPVAARSSTFAALRVRNYRLFFAGQMVSNTGTWMQRIAQDWLVLSITNSPLAVGITTALQFLPMLLFGLWGGLVADRFPKRLVLLVTQVSMGLLAAALAALTLTRSVEVWQVYLIALGLGFATVFDNPARQTFVNELVPTSLVRNAVALNSGNFQLARMVGPAVAGVLITLVGIGWAFALNALSFVAVIVALLAMRVRDLERLPLAQRGRGQLREGLRFVRRTPTLLWTVVLVFFVGTFGYNFAILLSAYARDVDGSASLFGWLNTAMAVGSVAGALVAARRGSGRLPVLFGVAAGVALTLLLLGLVAPWLWLFVVVLVVVGFLSVTFNTLGNATAQLASPPELRGRVISLYMLVFIGGTPLGSVTVGAITGAFGPRVALLVCGGACLVGVIGAAVLAARQAGMPPAGSLGPVTDPPRESARRRPKGSGAPPKEQASPPISQASEPRRTRHLWSPLVERHN